MESGNGFGGRGFDAFDSSNAKYYGSRGGIQSGKLRREKAELRRQVAAQLRRLRKPRRMSQKDPISGQFVEGPATYPEQPSSGLPETTVRDVHGTIARHTLPLTVGNTGLVHPRASGSRPPATGLHAMVCEAARSEVLQRVARPCLEWRVFRQ